MILAPTKPDISVEPRDYQSRAIDAAFDAWANGKTGSLVRLPTGTGKTVVGSLCAARWLDMGDDRRVFVCSHERQLIWQFAEEIQDLIGIDPAIEMADRSIHRDDVASGYARVVVASRATLLDRNGYSRLEKFDPQLKWLLIIDEAHRWARKLTSCNPVVEWFERNPESKRLGLTATPVRGDGVSLSGLFDHIAADYRLYDTDGGACAVEDGWAVPYDQRYVIVEGVDFRGLKEVAGDFDDAQLEQILGAQEQLAKLIEPTMELVGDRRTLVFSPGVGMSYAVANYINGKAGKVIAKALDGSVPEEKRREVYDEFERGELQWLSVCGLCREGYNCPGIQAVAVFRPTKSQGLAEQMKGRGCRPLRGTITSGMTRDERLAAIAASAKPYCMIIDLVGITGLADTATTAHLMTEGMDDEAAESVVREVNRRVMAAQETGEPVDPSKIMREVKLAKAEREELERQKKLAKLAPKVTYEAVKVPQGHTGPGAYQWRPEKRGARMLFGKHKGRTMGEIPTDYLDWVVTGSEARGWMREAAKAELEKRREAGDSPELATPKQLGWLRWQGIRPRDGLTKREASKIIGEMMESKEA